MYRPVGLKNIGQTCYVNSLIQAYFHIPKIKKAILTYPTQIKQEDINQQVEDEENSQKKEENSQKTTENSQKNGENSEKKEVLAGKKEENKPDVMDVDDMPPLINADGTPEETLAEQSVKCENFTKILSENIE